MKKPADDWEPYALDMLESILSGNDAARLPRIESDCDGHDRDQYADDYGELLQSHTFPECKKGARPAGQCLARLPAPVNLKP